MRVPKLRCASHELLSVVRMRQVFHDCPVVKSACIAHSDEDYIVSVKAWARGGEGGRGEAREETEERWWMAERRVNRGKTEKREEVETRGRAEGRRGERGDREENIGDMVVLLSRYEDEHRYIFSLHKSKFPSFLSRIQFPCYLKQNFPEWQRGTLTRQAAKQSGSYRCYLVPLTCKRQKRRRCQCLQRAGSTPRGSSSLKGLAVRSWLVGWRSLPGLQAVSEEACRAARQMSPPP
ncbi:hypothetical protein O3P69_017656 [Scylla paramamosain]|uniref:Uncharacterized protein n=1 Tax=Scylla paramamosain TaxID=85552 RepID=A0AAW0TY73_SCYPA